jgi:hypothetical protein
MTIPPPPFLFEIILLSLKKKDMNWSEERKKILDVFDKFPKKRGSRTDIHSDKITYDRKKLISDELNGLFRHGNMLPQVYEMILNDTDTQFFTKGLVKYNWSIPGAYKIYENNYYQYDFENDDIIISKINNNEITPKTTTIIQEIERHYKICDENFLYFMEIKDDNEIFKYRKLGVTNNLTGRINTFNTNIPFEIYPIALWNVEYGKTIELETLLHKELRDVHKKGEWFIDDNFNLINRVRNLIKNVEHINIMEVHSDERLKKK